MLPNDSRQRSIAQEVLRALVSGGKTGREIIMCCRGVCSPSEVAPMLTYLIEMKHIFLQDGVYYPMNKRARLGF